MATSLRPILDPDKNIFTAAVAALYRTDTCTNVFPSIHVYNSIGTYIAIHKSPSVSGKSCLKGRRSHFNRSDLSFYCIFKAAFRDRRSRRRNYGCYDVSSCLCLQPCGRRKKDCGKNFRIRIMAANKPNKPPGKHIISLPRRLFYFILPRLSS